MSYRPRLEELSKVRIDELAAAKSKVRTSPGEVETWFDKEIARAGNIDVNDISKQM